jgi:hypothetical protein
MMQENSLRGVASSIFNYRRQGCFLENVVQRIREKHSERMAINQICVSTFYLLHMWTS